MDIIVSAPEAARALDTTLPRVHRSMSRLGIGASVCGRLRLTGAEFRRLSEELGYAPVRDELNREQMFVLAALLQHSLGLRSARAVARVAGVSPTTAARALVRLENGGYVVHPIRRIIEGAVKDVKLWEIDWTSPAWQSVESDVRRTVPPVGVADTTSSTVPARLDHLFWNVDRSTLDTEKDGAFIALRIIGSSDLQALSWLASGAVSKKNLRRASRARGVSPRQRDFALNLARSL
jgi:hypothetical protein